MKKVYNFGINDCERGWCSKNETNKKFYKCWCHMLERCYSEKWHEKYPTYKDCYVCDRWLKLSNFVEDLPKIDNYNLWLENKEKYELDKDIKSDGKNKCYCLEECMFVTKKENVKQSIKTKNFDYMRGYNNWNKNGFSEETKKKMSEAKKNKYDGKNNPNAKKVAQYDLDGNLIRVWNCAKEISNELEINYKTLLGYLQGKRKTHICNNYIWKYVE